MSNQTPRFRVKKDNSGGYYWMFYAANGEEIARSSESYAAKRNCLHSIALVKSGGPTASVFDWTVPTDAQGNHPAVPASQIV
jgi:uncharacterized protein YegP (UPF0339 family)